MAIPNLLDPRMLNQVAVPPPLSPVMSVDLPPPAPAPSVPPPPTPMLPPTLPTGMGFDARPQRPPPPTFVQTLVKAIPMILAGIAAAKSGPAATGGMLAGYADALEKKRLLEEKQHEFDVQTAATDEERQLRRQQYQAAQQEKIVGSFTSLVNTLKDIEDPVLYAATVAKADEAFAKGFGTPVGFITGRLGGTFSDTKRMAKAQKDAQARLATIKAELGENYDDALARNDKVTDPATGKPQYLRDLAAAAGLDITGPGGEPTRRTPKIKTQFEQDQADLDAAVQQKQKELGRPLTPAEIRALNNQLRGEAAAAVRGDPSVQHTTLMFEGQPTDHIFDQKTKTWQVSRDETGKPMRTPPTQALINMNAAKDFAQEDITADRPDPLTANKIDPATGMTPNTLYQYGMTLALTGQMPALGQSNSGQMGRARQAIVNKGAAIVAQSGVDLPQLRAEYKAKAPALARLTNMYTQTAAAAGAANDSIDLAIEQAKRVPRGQRPILNTFTQWLATGDKALSSDPELAQLQLYVYTAARDYGKVVSGSAASVAGLTDYQAKAAEKLLSAAQSPETFANVARGMQTDMKVVTDNQNREIAKTSQDIANFLGNATGLGVPARTTTATTTDTGGGAKSKVTINGRTVTGPTGVPHTYPTEQAAQAAYAALSAIK